MKAVVDLLVLSPHLDDGVFSCGGRIARAVAAGERVRVVTFYTGEPKAGRVSSRLAKFADYTQRRAEDVAALDALGAEHEWRGYVERAFRPPPLSRLTAVFRTPATADGFDNLAALSAELEADLVRHPSARLLAPLAVGNHFDHAELSLAALTAMIRSRSFERFAFYEDAYALGTRVRARHPVTRTRLWRPAAAPERSSLRARAMFSLLALVSGGPSAVELLPDAAPGLDWRCEPGPTIELERKLAAVNRYVSQVAMLGGPERWGDIVARYHHYWEGGEPLWHASPRAEEL